VKLFVDTNLQLCFSLGFGVEERGGFKVGGVAVFGASKPEPGEHASHDDGGLGEGWELWTTFYEVVC
jgi:hypothetical protein